MVNGGDSGVSDRGAEPNTGDAPPEGVVVVEDVTVSIGRQWEESSSKGTKENVRLGRTLDFILGCVCVVDGAGG